MIKKIDILVGTQMLSKGHDYHNVDLAIIMGIDEQLEYADFRAKENTLALAMQVAGRAGRLKDGKVVFQTLHREFFQNYIDNYDDFIKDELEFRKDFGYPPFTRLLRILISHKSEEYCTKTLERAIEILKDQEGFYVVGYGSSNIKFLMGKYRKYILLRSNSHTPLLKAAKSLEELDVEIDMDPVNFQ